MSLIQIKIFFFKFCFLMEILVHVTQFNLMLYIPSVETLKTTIFFFFFAKWRSLVTKSPWPQCFFIRFLPVPRPTLKHHTIITFMSIIAHLKHVWNFPCTIRSFGEWHKSHVLLYASQQSAILTNKLLTAISRDDSVTFLHSSSEPP